MSIKFNCRAIFRPTKWPLQSANRHASPLARECSREMSLRQVGLRSAENLRDHLDLLDRSVLSFFAEATRSRYMDPPCENSCRNLSRFDVNFMQIAHARACGTSWLNYDYRPAGERRRTRNRGTYYAFVTAATSIRQQREFVTRCETFGRKMFRS